MTPYITMTGLVLPIDRANVDTDAIIPKQYMKMIGRTGFGKYLFDEWRYVDPAEPGDDCNTRRTKPDCVLNDPRYQGASILLGRANFGCGSSREHAVWALAEWGIRVLIAPSFAEIFRDNCVKNGLLPIALPEKCIEVLFAATLVRSGLRLTIDLSDQKVIATEALSWKFEISASQKQMLLDGSDEIDLTLQHLAEIETCARARLESEPWLAVRA